MSKEKTKEWLEKKPDPIIAYKTAVERYWGYGATKISILPIIFAARQGPFKKTNKLKKRSLLTVNVGKETEKGSYKAGYHLCLTKKGAEDWAGIVLKCTILKKNIIAVGRQNNFTTIITTEFTFIEDNELFEKE